MAAYSSVTSFFCGEGFTLLPASTPAQLLLPSFIILSWRFSFVCNVMKRRTRRFHHIRVISTFRSFRRALYTRGDVYVHGETTSVLDPGKNDRETVIRYQLPRRSADRHGVNLSWGKSGLLKHSSVHGLKFQEEVQRQFNNLQLCAMAKKRSG